MCKILIQSKWLDAAFGGGIVEIASDVSVPFGLGVGKEHKVTAGGHPVGR